MANAPLLSRPTATQRVILIGFPIAVGLMAPSLIRLAVQCMVGGVPLGTAVADIVEKQFARGHNFFVLAFIGLIPFVVLAAKLSSYVASRTRRTCCVLCLTGLVGILALMIPAHVSVWYPAY